jgi:hypothetical protein
MREPPYPAIETEWVDENTIRAIFNHASIWQKVLSGGFGLKLVRDRPARAESESGQPAGTRSQQLIIFNETGGFVAKVHRYLRAGQPFLHERPPDPKRVVVGEKMYALLATPGQPQTPMAEPPE